MSLPKCPQCPSQNFQLTVSAILNSNFKIALIHCSSCGCVVGTQEPVFLFAVLEKIAKYFNISI